MTEVVVTHVASKWAEVHYLTIEELVIPQVLTEGCGRQAAAIGTDGGTVGICVPTSLVVGTVVTLRDVAAGGDDGEVGVCHALTLTCL